MSVVDLHNLPPELVVVWFRRKDGIIYGVPWRDDASAYKTKEKSTVAITRHRFGSAKMKKPPTPPPEHSLTPTQLAAAAHAVSAMLDCNGQCEPGRCWCDQIAIRVSTAIASADGTESE